MNRTEYSTLEKMLNLLGSKWVLLILQNLREKPHGFNQLLRSIEGISPRILSLRLKSLAEAGLISKKILPTNPPQVEYSLTKKGISLQTVILSLSKWAESGTSAGSKR